MAFTEQQYQEMKARLERSTGRQVAEKEVAACMTAEVTADLTIRPCNDEARLNKTERAYLAYLRRLNPPYIGIQNITLKLADDCRYTCDFNWKNENGRIVFDEVKGFMRPDAEIKLKVAARLYRFFTFRLVRRSGTSWEIKEVKP